MSNATISNTTITNDLVVSTTTEVALVGVEVSAATAEFIKVKKAIAELEKQEAALRAVLLEAAGSADEVLFEGKVIYTLNRSTRRSNDAKVLAEKFPEAYLATLRETAQVRITTK